MGGKQAERVIIGETYFFEGCGENNEGLLGTVTTATVSEGEKVIYVGVATPDGRGHILTQPISDAALADYKAHPDAFFGVIQHAGRKTENIYEWDIAKP